ncbi:hypothetical protein PFISCL1PPCAC_15714, partial [Pristionchus fissidentatus]
MFFSSFTISTLVEIEIGYVLYVSTKLVDRTVRQPRYPSQLTIAKSLDSSVQYLLEDTIVASSLQHPMRGRLFVGKSVHVEYSSRDLHENLDDSSRKHESTFGSSMIMSSVHILELRGVEKLLFSRVWTILAI